MESTSPAIRERDLTKQLLLSPPYQQLYSKLDRHVRSLPKMWDQPPQIMKACAANLSGYARGAKGTSSRKRSDRTARGTRGLTVVMEPFESVMQARSQGSSQTERLDLTLRFHAARCTDRYSTLGKVDVTPRQAHHFADSHTGV